MREYTKHEWTNGGTPAISATNLDEMEDGIEMSIYKDVGFIAFYCNPIVPVGWLVCDGSEVSRTTYSKLYSCIGETFGSGDGKSTFNLPDLRGEFIRGWNNSETGIDVSREFGSKQDGTRFTTTRTGARYIDGGDNVPNVRETDAGSTASPTNVGAIRIRPNNVALLPCIFTGVFDN